MNTGSYDIHRSHRDIDSEVARLHLQATAAWKKELRNLVGFGLRDGMSILEVGSGPGHITEYLMEALPAAQFTAVEVDGALADQARLRLEHREPERLRIIHASVLDSGLPDNTFDFAIARLVFQHLPDPHAAASEILRLLKRGGHLVIIDSDDALWGLSEPEIPEMAAALGDYGRIQAAQGGNRLSGRALLRTLDRAGFTNLDLEALLNHSDQLGLEALLPHLDPDRLLPLVNSGAMSASRLEDFRASHQRFLNTPDPMLMMLLIMACGEKP